LIIDSPDGPQFKGGILLSGCLICHQRLRSALELLFQTLNLGAKDKRSAQQVSDLGFGPGNITKYFVEAFPEAQIYGIEYGNSC
jgi:trans-aconitate methyltransferase